MCRCERLSYQGNSAYCHRCSKTVEVFQTPNLQVKIIPAKGLPTPARLSGSMVDKVLCFDAPFVALYNEDVLGTKKKLVASKVVGTFIIDHLDHIVGFNL